MEDLGCHLQYVGSTKVISLPDGGLELTSSGSAKVVYLPDGGLGLPSSVCGQPHGHLCKVGSHQVWLQQG